MNYHPENDMTEDEQAYWEAKAEEVGKGSGASPCSPIDHLVILHRVLYNTVTDREALDYLNRFRREDADFADMGRPLKSQYQENEKGQRP